MVLFEKLEVRTKEAQRKPRQYTKENTPENLYSFWANHKNSKYDG